MFDLLILICLKRAQWIYTVPFLKTQASLQTASTSPSRLESNCGRIMRHRAASVPFKRTRGFQHTSVIFRCDTKSGFFVWSVSFPESPPCLLLIQTSSRRPGEARSFTSITHSHSLRPYIGFLTAPRTNKATGLRSFLL